VAQIPWPAHWLGQKDSVGTSHRRPPTPSIMQKQAKSGLGASHQPLGPKMSSQVACRPHSSFAPCFLFYDARGRGRERWQRRCQHVKRER
jgi:hypothetical protein